MCPKLQCLVLTCAVSISSSIRSQHNSRDSGEEDSLSASTAWRALRPACSCFRSEPGCSNLSSRNSGLATRHRASSQTSSSNAVRSPSLINSIRLSSPACPSQPECSSVLYTCAFKPGCLMSHSWLHTSHYEYEMKYCTTDERYSWLEYGKHDVLLHLTCYLLNRTKLETHCNHHTLADKDVGTKIMTEPGQCMSTGIVSRWGQVQDSSSIG